MAVNLKTSEAPAIAPDDINNAVEALKTKKEPPPEDATSITIRRLVILSFWLLAILLGLPTWWRTTTVYRANLPLQTMSHWANGNVHFCSIASQDHS